MWGANVTFAQPWMLLLLVVVPVVIFWYLRRGSVATTDLRYSTLRAFTNIRPTFRERTRPR